MRDVTRVGRAFACAIAVVLLSWEAAGGFIIATPTSETIAPDSFFDITYTVDTEGDLMYSYNLDFAINPGGSSLFELWDWDTTGSPFSEVFVPPVLPETLDPQTNQAYNGNVPGIPGTPVEGTNLLMGTFTFHALPTLAQGTYTLSVVDWMLYMQTGGELSGDPAAPVTLTYIVPEPGALVILALGLPAILLRRRRRD
ncbi:MAG: PEP-CTERM sorting domain-containing protein [Lentisphaeria bacterium]|nr:PEP-CTERM sorting domain-containing protein [Lentisphaeria bacterium]